MRTITEQQIIGYAPNPNGVANGRKISSGGGFLSRMRSADDTFYMGECKGSGKSNYVVSADFLEEASPVFRCSCPSRQFPCKHSIALLFEILAKKEFIQGEIPEDILKKREKKAKKAEESDKAEAEGTKGDKMSEEEAAKAAARRQKAGKAAKAKKIKKQLEGLEMTKRLIGGLMRTGLSTMGSVSLKTYRDLAKQLGDYYLPGPQRYLNQLILEMEAFQKDQDPEHYKAAVDVLKRLHGLCRKAGVYLTEKLEKDTPEADDDMLYEELGGIWKLDQLNALGLKKENARLLQLSFQVVYREAGKEFIDLGYWIDADTGEVFTTWNYRPIKALKYIKQEDSCFALLKIPVLSLYPGELNKRVRWEATEYKEAGEDIYRQVKALAHQEIAGAVKIAKNQIKNILSEDSCGMMIAYKRVGMVRTEAKISMVMEDASGKRIMLRGRNEEENICVEMLKKIPDRRLLNDQALFGLVYYDAKDHSMCMAPLSVVTDQGIIRLLY